MDLSPNKLTDEQHEAVLRATQADATYPARRALYERLMAAQRATEQRLIDAKAERIAAAEADASKGVEPVRASKHGYSGTTEAYVVR